MISFTSEKQMPMASTRSSTSSSFGFSKRQRIRRPSLPKFSTPASCIRQARLLAGSVVQALVSCSERRS